MWNRCVSTRTPHSRCSSQCQWAQGNEYQGSKDATEQRQRSGCTCINLPATEQWQCFAWLLLVGSFSSAASLSVAFYTCRQHQPVAVRQKIAVRLQYSYSVAPHWCPLGALQWASDVKWCGTRMSALADISLINPTRCLLRQKTCPGQGCVSKHASGLTDRLLAEIKESKC